MRRYAKACSLAGIALLANSCAAPATPQQAPVTPGDTPGIASQVRQSWNIGSFADDPNCKGVVVTIHVSLLPDGTITKIEPDNDQRDGGTVNNACYQRAYESAGRALLMTHRLTLPPGKTYSVITFRFMPEDIN